MSTRFSTNGLLALAGGFVVVASQAFQPGVTGWITFGIALGIVGVLGIAQLDRGRGRLQRALDALTGALGIWMVVASVVFTAQTLTWLSFGEGLGVVALALAGLAAHELSTERVVHALAIEDRRRDSEHDHETEPYSAAA